MKLKDICEINPRMQKIDDSTEVSFVSMPSVSEDGKIDTTDIRRYSDVKKGYTSFKENDVLFAKITPCMENGKGAIARGLRNGYGCGSSEFHVLRSNDKAMPEWIYCLTSWQRFREKAEKHMTGSAGQRRVPKQYLENYEIRLPGLKVQAQQVETLMHLRSIIDRRITEVRSFDELIKARFVEMFDLSNCAYKSLGECTDFVDYRGHTPELSDEGTIRMINAKSVGKGFFKYVDEFITEKTYESWMHRGFGYPGDILFVTEGHTFGNTCLIPKDMTKFALGQRVITIKGRDEIENAFLCSYMQTDMFWKDINVYRTGGTAQGIRSKDLIKVMVPIPPIEQQKDFVKFVNQVDKSKFDGMAWQRWLFSVGMKSAGGNNPCGAKEQDKDEFGRKK